MSPFHKVIGFIAAIVTVLAGIGHDQLVTAFGSKTATIVLIVGALITTLSKSILDPTVTPTTTTTAS